jgi:PAS domain S-box-containing protein
MDDAFRACFDRAPVGIGIAGPDWRFLRANDALCRLFDLSEEELCATAWAELAIPEDMELVSRFVKRMADDPDAPRELEARFSNNLGIRWAHIRASAVGDLSGRPARFIVWMEDTTERKLLDTTLSESEARFKLMADSCPSMMWVTGPRGEVRFVNQAYRSFCGIDEGKSGENGWEQLIWPTHAREYVARLERAIAKLETFSAEAVIRLANGQRRLIGSVAKPCISPQGKYLGHVGLTANITERVEAEKHRQFEFSLIRAIHDESLEGILVVNEEGGIVSINQPFMELWGIGNPKAANRGVEELAGTPVRPVLLSILESLAEPEEFLKKVNELSTHPNERDYRDIVLKDGRTVEAHSSGLRGRSCEYFGRVWYFRDVTTQKRAELGLKKAKEAAEAAHRQLHSQHLSLDNERRTLRALIDNVPDFMYVKDTQSRFIVANVHTARSVGANSAESLVGKTDFDFFPPEMARRFYEDEQALLVSGEPLYNREETALDEARQEIKILTTKVPLRDGDGKIVGLAGVGRNITNRIQMENALREAEGKFRGIFDNAIMGIFQSTPQGRLLSVNPALASMFGYASPEEMIALVSDARQLYGDRGERELHKVRSAKHGNAQNHEGQSLRKDGTRFWVSVWMRGILENGAIVRYEGMCEDITERKSLQEQLLQAQKLESIGQLAAGIAHEINTPTQYIGDNTRFVRDAFEDLKCLWDEFQNLVETAGANENCHSILGEISATTARIDAPFLIDEIPKAIDQALEGASRVATLVAAMKEFSHPGSKEKTPIDLNHAIENTITVARNEWKYIADLETDFDKSLPHVSCLPAEFNQVILNLIVNAAHAIADALPKGSSGKGKITVETHKLPTCAEIRIADTGTGIPEAIRNRIFDPFFTTKEIGKGTGQGLAIARSVVVDKHGGTIRFETEEGKGTTFIVCLPL